jgi:hypothetical protein
MATSTITFGFSRPSKLWPPPLFAWLIMLFDWSKFSHAYIRFHSDSYDRDLVYQASGLRVNFMGWKLFKSQEVIVKEFDIEVTPETKQAVIQFAIDRVGTPYALWAAIIGIPAVKIAAMFGYKIKNPVSQMGDFCSELAALVMKDYLNAQLTDDDVKRMTPTDVCNYLLEHSEE